MTGLQRRIQEIEEQALAVSLVLESIVCIDWSRYRGMRNGTDDQPRLVATEPTLPWAGR